MADNKKGTDESRRKFLKNAGFTIGGVAIGGAVGGLLLGGNGEETQTVKNEVDTESLNFNKALMYFTPEQFETIDAATERIFPKTEVGPGAQELLVAYFIDHQLAGDWGKNTKEYMSGPFHPGEAIPEQGYQTHLRRHEIFDNGIVALNNEAANRFESDGKKPRFKDLDEEQQIEILKDFEEDKVEVRGVPSSTFFALLRQATLEGAYADPLYGGNKNMDGWRMKNFPGHQMNMEEQTGAEEFIEMEPQGLNSQHNH